MSPNRDDVTAVATGRPLVQLVAVGKSYPGVRALSDVNLEFRAGEIHSIVGENGAGKSTLVSMLAGLAQPDSGEILVDGQRVRFRNPRAARSGGVSFVPQEAEGVPAFSVGRSLMLGREGRWTNRSRLSPAERSLVADALEKMGASALNGDAPLSELSVAEVRLCQIAGTLVNPGRLIMLDEPTAVLADADAEILLSRLERLREEGKSILYVSHRLSEVLRISDRITVLRDGLAVGTFARGDIDRAGLLALMARRQGEAAVAAPIAGQAAVAPGGVPRLKVSGFSKGRLFRDIDLEVYPGQVVGIAGIQGSGHGRLLEALAGASSVDSGQLHVDGAAVRAGSLHHSLAAGIRLVPEERRQRGIVGPRSLRENVSIGYGSTAQSRFFRSPATERQAAAQAVIDLDIRTPGVEVRVQNLSGGNQQKVVIARVLASAPAVMLLCEPTQGIDVTSKAEILRLLRRAARQQGISVILASSEFEELLEYTDVIHVMRTGSIVATVATAQTSYAELLEAAVP